MLNQIKNRAMRQAGANTETQPAKVVKTYADDLGNVTHADVKCDGHTRILPRVPNSSGLRLTVGLPVTINYVRGSRFDREILAAVGSAGSLGGSGSGNASDAGSGDTTSGVDLSSIACLMQSPDEACPSAYTVAEGANVFFDSVDPVTGGGENDPVGGTLTIHVAPRVETALPDPSGLLDGTCVDLVDGSGASLGMYRRTNGQWIRRDSPSTATGGGSDVTADDRNRWDTAGTTAAEAATTATAVQTEVTGARTRPAISGSGITGYVYSSLQNAVAGLWNAIASRTANPSGVPDGYVQTKTSGGVVYAPLPSGGGGSGSVTSVDGSGGDTGLTVSGGPITGSGTLTLGGTLAVAHGGTGAGAAADARNNLGAAPLAWEILDLVATAGQTVSDGPTGTGTTSGTTSGTG